MTAAAVPAGPALARQLRRAQRRQQWRAAALTAPLLLFLLVFFLVPLASLLVRAVENPEVADALPATARALADWDGGTEPPAAAFAAVAADLRAIDETAQAGALARRLNSEAPGARSLIMGTYRAVREWTAPPADARQALLDLDPRWAELPYWQAIAKNTQRWTPDYLLASVDLRRSVDGGIERIPPEEAVFSQILWRTFEISAVVTLVALLMAYPLAYWLSTLPERRANLLLILVLLPFWTSVLVRIAAWIVLLQNNGLINQWLQGIGLIDGPLPLLFNRTGVVIAMVHILLPFMILPLYSVMKTIPPNYLRAAVSLGSHPLAAFVRVVLPQTYPGVAAGCLLVFITAIGYYVTPALLGGASDQMLSYYIAQYTNVEVNWGMACALGAVLLSATLVLFVFYRRVSRGGLSLG
ncbi:ABC transporter permease [Tepidimonas taiwanensis]|uniref:Spermidine/putrescine transport system permease protein PotB n=1 Tax=Tepidimonas taiwanensis TaxID=307486 RepID=A0A554X8I9_9BURK|nr:ABC transporter permease [Tepidimonas taiwanensis]MCX7693488.1 ABC transporter permease [Tepidimonas taiwanensis]MDM7464182.1 ABC transporter permease [Tepidimonas taiwanensis]TSE32143.1 Spermidine/putrescine transport system permease protein PotB [Tepidimonas taiwanensis]UBQ06059.1 ABC transporter permease [Tepidimonas taiwanensis]